jgi:hypothetical protein
MQKLCNNDRRQFLPAFRVFKNRHDKTAQPGESRMLKKQPFAKMLRFGLSRGRRKDY